MTNTILPVKSTLQRLLDHEIRLAVIGLGYVGLPMALAFSSHMSVVGFDINHERVESLRNAVDTNGEVDASQLADAQIYFTTNADDLRLASVFIIAVPTDVDESRLPDLRPLMRAIDSIGRVLQPGDMVVFESSVYPGCTEEECVPRLDKLCGLRGGKDYKYGHCPERMNPGDAEHCVEKLVRVVAGCDAEALDFIGDLYSLVVQGVHRAPSIKVAEAAKMTENIQRDVNVALMNELALVYAHLGVPSADVFEASRTKWNFLHFKPGFVGGHCVAVDPYYLIYKTKKAGMHPKILTTCRDTNEGVARHVADRVADALVRQGHQLAKCRALVLGVAFKENVRDIRNTKVFDLLKHLEAHGIATDLVDPNADASKVAKETGRELCSLDAKVGMTYEAVVAAVEHREYKAWDAKELASWVKKDGVVMDVKAMFHKLNVEFRPDIEYIVI